MKKLVSILFWTIIVLQISQAQTPNDNIGSGNCLDFDGVNNYIEVGDQSALKPAQLSIEAWVNHDGITTHRHIVQEGGISSATGLSGYGMRFTPTAQIEFFVIVGVEGFVSILSPTVAANEWKHVVGTYDRNTAKLYINGNIVASASETRAVDYTGTCQGLRIGAAKGNGNVVQYFDGHIDEVKVWDKPLTQTEIRDNMCTISQGNESGLVGYWNMNEGTGNIVTDLTSNGNDGTLQ